MRYVLSLLIQLVLATEAIASERAFYSFNYATFAKELREFEGRKVYGLRFQRDSRGEKCFLQYSTFDAGVRNYHGLMISSNVTQIKAFAQTWFADDGSPLCWLDGIDYAAKDGLSKMKQAKFFFKGGPAIPFSEIGEVSGVSGAPFVQIKFKDTDHWIIANVETPRLPIVEVPEVSRVQATFSLDDGLVVVGSTGTGSTFHLVGILLNKKDGGYARKVIQIPWGSGIFDASPNGYDTLIKGQATKFSHFYRFNLLTMKRIDLGFTPSDDILVLKKELITKLKKHPLKGMRAGQ
jgi:hypothetical protein